jgi:hypothetical protein
MNLINIKNIEEFKKDTLDHDLKLRKFINDASKDKNLWDSNKHIFKTSFYVKKKKCFKKIEDKMKNNLIIDKNFFKDISLVLKEVRRGKSFYILQKAGKDLDVELTESVIEKGFINKEKFYDFFMKDSKISYNHFVLDIILRELKQELIDFQNFLKQEIKNNSSISEEEYFNYFKNRLKKSLQKHFYTFNKKTFFSNDKLSELTERAIKELIIENFLK